MDQPLSLSAKVIKTLEGMPAFTNGKKSLAGTTAFLVEAILKPLIAGQLYSVIKKRLAELIPSLQNG